MGKQLESVDPYFCLRAFVGHSVQFVAESHLLQSESNVGDVLQTAQVKSESL